ncbi:hypothetical protein GCM10011297_32040 [Bacterioplanes sanyensis]|nr:hypothetical protein GCM10011297_32040 [Bacterioplanes sanyensis]
MVNKINGDISYDLYSLSKIELEPGIYSFDLEIQGMPGILASTVMGVAGGQAAMHTYMYGVDRTSETEGAFKWELKAGRIYAVSYQVEEGDKVVVSIEEI